MKTQLYCLLALVISGALAAGTCRAGYYGAKCNKACSSGCKGGTCDVEGVCTDTSGCEPGWKSTNTKSAKCEKPICFASTGGCDYDGDCIAPNYCICGKAGAQVVGLKRIFPGETEEGTNCVSLRKDGIIGAGFALLIVASAVTTCGVIAEKAGKPR